MPNVASSCQRCQRWQKRSPMIWCWWMKPTCCCRPRKRAWFLHIGNGMHRQSIDVMYWFVMSTGFCLRLLDVVSWLVCVRNLNRLLRTLQQQTGLKLSSFYCIGSAFRDFKVAGCRGFCFQSMENLQFGKGQRFFFAATWSNFNSECRAWWSAHNCIFSAEVPIDDWRAGWSFWFQCK